MEERIIDSIVKHLYELMPGLPCWVDTVWQDNDRPGFFLELVNTIQGEGMENHYWETYSFDLQFDPEPSTTPGEDARYMAFFLRANLRRIPAIDGGVLYAHNIQTRMADGIVHATFDIRQDYEIELPGFEDVETIGFLFEEKEEEECILKQRF